LALLQNGLHDPDLSMGDDERQVDTFNENDNRLFQVMKDAPSAEGISTDERTPGLLAATLASENPKWNMRLPSFPYPGLTKKAPSRVMTTMLQSTRNSPGRIIFPSSLTSFIAGNKDQVLQDPHAVVLSEELAMRLFNTTQNLVGRIVEWNQKRL